MDFKEDVTNNIQNQTPITNITLISTTLHNFDIYDNITFRFDAQQSFSLNFTKYTEIFKSMNKRDPTLEEGLLLKKRFYERYLPQDIVFENDLESLKKLRGIACIYSSEFQELINFNIDERDFSIILKTQLLNYYTTKLLIENLESPNAIFTNYLNECKNELQINIDHFLSMYPDREPFLKFIDFSIKSLYTDIDYKQVLLSEPAIIEFEESIHDHRLNLIAKRIYEVEHDLPNSFIFEATTIYTSGNAGNVVDIADFRQVNTPSVFMQDTSIPISNPIIKEQINQVDIKVPFPGQVSQNIINRLMPIPPQQSNINFSVTLRKKPMFRRLKNVPLEQSNISIQSTEASNISIPVLRPTVEDDEKTLEVANAIGIPVQIARAEAVMIPVGKQYTIYDNITYSYNTNKDLEDNFNGFIEHFISVNQINRPLTDLEEKELQSRYLAHYFPDYIVKQTDKKTLQDNLNTIIEQNTLELDEIRKEIDETIRIKTYDTAYFEIKDKIEKNRSLPSNTEKDELAKIEKIFRRLKQQNKDKLHGSYTEMFDLTPKGRQARINYLAYLEKEASFVKNAMEVKTILTLKNIEGIANNKYFLQERAKDFYPSVRERSNISTPIQRTEDEEKTPEVSNVINIPAPIKSTETPNISIPVPITRVEAAPIIPTWRKYTVYDNITYKYHPNKDFKDNFRDFRDHFISVNQINRPLTKWEEKELRSHYAVHYLPKDVVYKTDIGDLKDCINDTIDDCNIELNGIKAEKELLLRLHAYETEYLKIHNEMIDTMDWISDADYDQNVDTLNEIVEIFQRIKNANLPATIDKERDPYAKLFDLTTEGNQARIKYFSYLEKEESFVQAITDYQTKLIFDNIKNIVNNQYSLKELAEEYYSSVKEKSNIPIPGQISNNILKRFRLGLVEPAITDSSELMPSENVDIRMLDSIPVVTKFDNITYKYNAQLSYQDNLSNAIQHFETLHKLETVDVTKKLKLNDKLMENYWPKDIICETDLHKLKKLREDLENSSIMKNSSAITDNLNEHKMLNDIGKITMSHLQYEQLWELWKLQKNSTASWPLLNEKKALLAIASDTWWAHYAEKHKKFATVLDSNLESLYALHDYRQLLNQEDLNSFLKLRAVHRKALLDKCISAKETNQPHPFEEVVQKYASLDEQQLQLRTLRQFITGPSDSVQVEQRSNNLDAFRNDTLERSSQNIYQPTAPVIYEVPDEKTPDNPPMRFVLEPINTKLSNTKKESTQLKASLDVFDSSWQRKKIWFQLNWKKKISEFNETLTKFNTILRPMVTRYRQHFTKVFGYVHQRQEARMKYRRELKENKFTENLVYLKKFYYQKPLDTKNRSIDISFLFHSSKIFNNLSLKKWHIPIHYQDCFSSQYNYFQVKQGIYKELLNIIPNKSFMRWQLAKEYNIYKFFDSKKLFRKINRGAMLRKKKDFSDFLLVEDNSNITKLYNGQKIVFNIKTQKHNTTLFQYNQRIWRYYNYNTSKNAKTDYILSVVTDKNSEFSQNLQKIYDYTQIFGKKLDNFTSIFMQKFFNQMPSFLNKKYENFWNSYENYLYTRSSLSFFKTDSYNSQKQWINDTSIIDFSMTDYIYDFIKNRLIFFYDFRPFPVPRDILTWTRFCDWFLVFYDYLLFFIPGFNFLLCLYLLWMYLMLNSALFFIIQKNIEDFFETSIESLDNSLLYICFGYWTMLWHYPVAKYSDHKAKNIKLNWLQSTHLNIPVELPEWFVFEPLDLWQYIYRIKFLTEEEQKMMVNFQKYVVDQDLSYNLPYDYNFNIKLIRESYNNIFVSPLSKQLYSNLYKDLYGLTLLPGFVQQPENNISSWFIKYNNEKLRFTSFLSLNPYKFWIEMHQGLTDKLQVYFKDSDVHGLNMGFFRRKVDTAEPVITMTEPFDIKLNHNLNQYFFHHNNPYMLAIDPYLNRSLLTIFPSLGWNQSKHYWSIDVWEKENTIYDDYEQYKLSMLTEITKKNKRFTLMKSKAFYQDLFWKQDISSSLGYTKLVDYEDSTDIITLQYIFYKQKIDYLNASIYEKIKIRLFWYLQTGKSFNWFSEYKYPVIYTYSRNKSSYDYWNFWYFLKYWYNGKIPTKRQLFIKEVHKIKTKHKELFTFERTSEKPLLHQMALPDNTRSLQNQSFDKRHKAFFWSILPNIKDTKLSIFLNNYFTQKEYLLPVEKKLSLFSLKQAPAKFKQWLSRLFNNMEFNIINNYIKFKEKIWRYRANVNFRENPSPELLKFHIFEIRDPYYKIFDMHKKDIKKIFKKVNHVSDLHWYAKKVPAIYIRPTSTKVFLFHYVHQDSLNKMVYHTKKAPIDIFRANLNLYNINSLLPNNFRALKRYYYLHFYVRDTLNEFLNTQQGILPYVNDMRNLENTNFIQNCFESNGFLSLEGTPRMEMLNEANKAWLDNTDIKNMSENLLIKNPEVMRGIFHFSDIAITKEMSIHLKKIFQNTEILQEDLNTKGVCAENINIYFNFLYNKYSGNNFLDVNNYYTFDIAPVLLGISFPKHFYDYFNILLGYKTEVDFFNNMNLGSQNLHDFLINYYRVNFANYHLVMYQKIHLVKKYKWHPFMIHRVWDKMQICDWLWLFNK